MNAQLFRLFCLLAALPGLACAANNWVNIPAISPTTSLVADRICYTDGRDLACDGAAGLLTTSGTIQITTVSGTNLYALSVSGSTGTFGSIGVGNINASGQVTATTLTVGTVSSSGGGTVSATYGYFTYISATNGLASTPNWYSITNIPTPVQDISNGTGPISATSFYAGLISSTTGGTVSATNGYFGSVSGSTGTFGSIGVGNINASGQITATTLTVGTVSSSGGGTVSATYGYFTYISATNGSAATPGGPSGSIQFNLNGSSISGSTAFMIQNGNVGIGTTSPGSPLQISNSLLSTSDFSTQAAPRQLEINDLYTNTSNAQYSTVSIFAQPNVPSNSSSTDVALQVDSYIPATQTAAFANKMGIYSEANAANSSVKNLYGALFNTLYNGSGTASQLYGSLNEATNNSTGTVTSVQGSEGIAVNNSTGTVTDAYGAFNQAWNQSGPMTNGYGAYNEVRNNQSANIGTAYGSYNHIYNRISSGTIGTAYAGEFAFTNNAGTITNGYGVYITGLGGSGNGTWTNTPYDLYAADNGAWNYFAGSVGIGAVTPTANLEVSGTISASDVYVTATTGTVSATYGYFTYISATNGSAATPGGPSGSIQLNLNGSSISGSTAFMIQNGDVGIETTSPSVPLQIGNPLSSVFLTTPVPTQAWISDVPTLATGGALFMAQGIFSQPAPGSASVNTGYAAQYAEVGQPSTASGSNLSAAGTALYGVYGAALNAGSGTVGQMAAGEFITKSAGTSTITTGYGVQSLVVAVSTGTITTGIGGIFTVGAKQSGVITNAAGVAIGPMPSNATNSTGLLIGTTSIPSGTYGIYDSSTNSNYFAGNVGIGTSSPSANLEVSGTISASDVYVTATTGTVSATYGYFRYISGTLGAGAVNLSETLALNDLSDVSDSVAAGSIIAGPGTPQGLTTTQTTVFGVGAMGGAGATAGYQNTAFGYEALYSNTSGQNNTAVGASALFSNTIGNQNVAVGSGALAANTTGTNNTVVGYGANTNNNLASSNSVFGARALGRNNGGSNNTAVGSGAALGGVNAMVTDTIALGLEAGLRLTSSSENLLIGNFAGQALTTGSGNLLIGNNAAAPLATTNNYLNISNTITADMTNSLAAGGAGLVGINVQIPTASLEVSGSISASDIYVTATTGTVSATYGYFTYISATNGLGSAGTASDRIVSGSTSMVAQSASNVISITTAGTTTGYFNSNGVLTVPGISATANLTSVTSLYASANVGIGTPSPTSALQVNAADSAKTYTIYNGTGNTQSVEVDGLLTAINSTAAPTGNDYGNLDYMLVSPPAGSGALFWGRTIETVVPPTATNGTTGSVTGLFTRTFTNGAGTIASLAGINDLIDNTSTSTVTTQYLLFAHTTNTGTITNGYGIYITGEGSGGTWTHTPYDLIAADSGALNYFAGMVGIGAVTPTANLEVSGSISASNIYVTATTGTVSATYGYFTYISATSGLSAGGGSGDRIVSGTTSLVAQTASNIISITTGGTTTGYFNSNGVLTVPGISATANLTSVTSLYASGNVGIGTTTPDSPLQINNATDQKLSLSGSASPRIYFESSNSTYDNYALDIVGGLRVQNISASRTEMQFDGNGNVGIDTSSPVFDANSSIFVAVNNSTAHRSSEIGVGGNAGTADTVGQFGFYNSSLGGSEKRIATILAQTDGATNEGNLQFYTYNGSGWNEAMLINHTGNAGLSGGLSVGAISPPASGLTVNTAVTPTITVQLGGTTEEYLYDDGSYFYVQSASAGNGAKLQHGATLWTSASDRRIKKDIASLPSSYGLSAIEQLKPVTFHWRDPRSPQQLQIGLIAQDVQPVIPEFVTHSAPSHYAPDGELGIEYSGLVVPLIKAVQELKGLFDGDHAAITQLKADNDNLRREFEAYKAAHP